MIRMYDVSYEDVAYLRTYVYYYKNFLICFDSMNFI